MTQIQPFPAGPFPAIALALAEGAEISADPAIFLAMAGDETAVLQGDAGLAGPALPPPVVPGWPLPPPAAVEAPIPPEAGVEGVAPEAIASDWPTAEAMPFPPPKPVGLVEEPDADRLPEAEDAAPAVSSPLPPPAAAPLVPIVAAALPVQAGPQAMAAVPERMERPGWAAMKDEGAMAAGPLDRTAQSGLGDGVVPPPVPKVTEAAKVAFASAADAGNAGSPIQDTAPIPVGFGPQDALGGEELVTFVKRVAPAAVSDPPERLFPVVALPMKPAVGETGVAISETPAVEVTARRAEGRAIVADPPDFSIEGRSLQSLAQPGMAREERLWRSIWPVAGTGPVTAPAAAALVAPMPVSPMPGEGNVAPEALAIVREADVKVADKATEGVEAMPSPSPSPSPAKPEPSVIVSDRVAQVAPGPANAPAAPLPAMVVPVGDPVPNILRSADIALPANPAQTPATPPVQVQIMQAVFSGGTATELRLMPEELGHVRIDMRHEGDRLVMSVSAERQETLDLLRRHAGELAAELRAAGHSALDLSFGRWSGPGAETGGRSAGDPAADAPRPPADASALQPAPVAESLSYRPASGLYLRI